MKSKSNPPKMDLFADSKCNSTLCLFYKSQTDLLTVLSSYFKNGLENDELCIWLTSENRNEARIKRAMKKVNINFDEYSKNGQILITSSTVFHNDGNKFHYQRFIDFIVSRAKLNPLYKGIKLAFDMTCLDKKEWSEFANKLKGTISQYPIMAIYVYPFSKCEPNDIADIISKNEFLIDKKDDEWKLIENPCHPINEKFMQSDERYRTLAEASQDMIFIINKDGYVEYVNNFGAMQFNAKPSDIIGKRMVELFPTDVANEQRDNIQKTLETNKPIYFESKTCFINREAWLETWLVPLKDKNGEVHSVMGVSRDITIRKEIEEKIARIGKIYSVLSEVNQAIVRVKDVNKLFDIICKSAIEYGKLKMVWIGLIDNDSKLVKPVSYCGFEDGYLNSIVISTEDISTGRGPTGAAIRTGKSFICNDIKNSEFMLPWRDDAIKRGYLSSGAFPLKIGDKVIGTINVYADKVGFFGEEEVKLFEELASDISFALETIEHEKQRRQAEELYRSLIEISPDAITVTDINSKIILSNRQSAIMYGYENPEEMIGKSAFEFIEPKYHQYVIKNIQKTLELGYIKNVEYTLIRKDGTKFLGELNASVIKDANGNPIAFIGVLRDITERRRIEEEIKKLNDDLRRRAMELESANKELESFNYSVSHDLRSPLLTIDGFSQILLKEYSDKLDSRAIEYLKRIIVSTKNMAQLINDLLTLSRIMYGEIHNDNIDLSDLVEIILTELKISDPLRHVEFVIEPEVKVIGDKRLIKIMLQNLLSNAWKFTSKTKHGKIEFGTRNINNEMIYFIRDNGIGFDMTQAEKLFEPFQRFHKSSEFPGTGVGLTIVKRIIHRHNGNIWAESEVDKGTTFYFTISSVN